MAQRQNSFANKMGQTQMSGFGVLNKSEAAEINIGLSMGFAHHYENGVKQGKIAYWRPGAVFYTVFAYARADKYDSNDISGGTIFSDAHCCSNANCYGGSGGSWLIVEGGESTKNEEGGWFPGTLTIRMASKKELFDKGTFTEASHSRFHTEDGFECTGNCDLDHGARVKEI